MNLHNKSYLLLVLAARRGSSLGTRLNRALCEEGGGTQTDSEWHKQTVSGIMSISHRHRHGMTVDVNGWTAHAIGLAHSLPSCRRECVS